MTFNDVSPSMDLAKLQHLKGKNGVRKPPQDLELEVEKKHRIALSFKLDHCWFCGRPMTPCSR